MPTTDKQQTSAPAHLPLMDQEDEGARRKPNYSEIIRPTLQYELYNPADHTVEFAFNGDTYKIPAHNRHWSGKDPYTGQQMVYPKPGVLPVWGPAAIPGRKIEFTARDIVAFACGPDGISGSVGGLGIRPMFGDERDEEVTFPEAQSAWAEQRQQQAQISIRQHEQKVADAKASGTPPPFPGRQVLEAYSLRNAYESQIGFKFLCTICNMGFRNSQTEVYVHTISFHKDRRDAVEEAETKLSVVKNPLTGELEERPLGKTDLTPEETEPIFNKPLPTGAQNMGQILNEVGGEDHNSEPEPIRNTGAKVPVPSGGKR